MRIIFGDDKKEDKEEKEDKVKSLEDEIAEKILSQQDRLGILLRILEKLPPFLVDWLAGVIKVSISTKNWVEIGISNIICSGLYLPGDIVIRNSRDPKVGDIVEVDYRISDKDEYGSGVVKVLNINFKGGTLNVQNLFDPNVKGVLATNNVICVVDKVIEYGTPEWKKIVNTFNIVYNITDIENCVKKQIEVVEKIEKFHDKENNLKKLNERLKIVNKG